MVKYIILLFVISSLSLAEPIVYMDYAQFKTNTEGFNLVEIYISIPKYSLKFDDKLESKVKLDVAVSKNGSVVASDVWGEIIIASSENDTKSVSEYPVMTKFILSPDKYDFKVIVTDLNSNEFSEISLPETTGLFKIEKLKYFSTIQFASKIDLAQENQELFNKTGFTIVPNPRKLFGTHIPFLYFYQNIYFSKKEENLIRKIKVTDYSESTDFYSKTDTIKAIADFGISTGKVKVHNLETASYKLIISYENEEGIYTSKSDFNVFSKSKNTNPNLSNFNKDNNIDDALLKMNDKDVDKEFQIIMNISPSKEREIQKKLSIEGKRNYLKSYWEQREKEIPGIRNTFLFYVYTANKDYSFRDLEGWQTDRGRILIKLGKPDKVDINTINTDLSDYEVWEYFSSGNTYVFGDIHNLGDYRLIHSTDVMEVTNTEWKTLLNRSANKGKF
ncbi:MAG: GWxTD domain-containing protein [Candidatus Delongbacteria bacterium]|nr:GWxTD domain-containing protein [Candidatus Delongbacteria bacterium]MBN2837024.1 GWxTD domain-containing protein [Candidatus Delongbacteria bacterium]